MAVLPFACPQELKPIKSQAVLISELKLRPPNLLSF